jgi:5-methyltetrahydropteroyltriglutamate--homocysteine methyltransferase
MTVRADVVGSLLRPEYLKQARASGSSDEVRAAEDRAVREAVALQEAVGLDVLGDGEMRRWSWIASAPAADQPLYVPPLAGFSLIELAAQGWIRGWRDASGQAVQRPVRPRVIVTERLRPQRDIVADEYGFLRQLTSRRTKYCFPAPSYHRVFWHPSLSSAAYPTVDDFLQDVCEYIREHVIGRAVELGCDYVQMDAPNYGQFYTDDEIRAEFQAEGHDLDANLVADAEIDNLVFSGLPAGVTRALHICRGNGPGGIWSAAGGYDRLAPVLFPRLANVDRLLLEYDTPRAGDFSPLRHVLPGSTVVLGLLTTKAGAPEDPSQVKQRITEAAHLLPLDRLALSPQCGFNSAGIGNPLSFAEQEAKLRLVVSVARDVWDSS